MSDHIADVGKMVGARDVLARARCERHWRTPCDMSGCAEFGCEWRKGAEADLAALSAAGLVVVPREPTREMWAASANALVNGRVKLRAHHDHISGTVWSAMTAASQEGHR